MRLYEPGLAVYFLRMLKNMTQKDLASDVGVRQDYISHIESGHTKPTLATLESIVDSLDSNMSDFFILAERIPELDVADKKMIKMIFKNAEKQKDLMKQMMDAVCNYN